MTEGFLLLVVSAILVEAVVETLKMVWKPGSFSFTMLLAMGVGILVSILANLDVFMLAGVNIGMPYVANVLTGIIISRGANYLFDLFSKLKTPVMK